VAEIQANLAGEHRQGRWFESTIRVECCVTGAVRWNSAA
jgi:hypothetical protein